MSPRKVPRAESDNGIPCPVCGGVWHKVTDSRPSPGCVRRRMQCKACGERFTTYERIAEKYRRVHAFSAARLHNHIKAALREIERAKEEA